MIDLRIIAVVFSAWLVVSSVVRFRKAARLGAAPVAGGARVRGALPALLNYIAAILVALGIGLGAGPIILPGALNYVYAFAIVLFLTTTVDTIAAFKYPAGSGGTKLLAPAVAVLIAAGFLVYVALMLTAPGGASDQVNLAYPVKGAWRVVAGGRFKVTNDHHDNPPAQSYAVDMVCTNGPTAGQQVYAPIGGVVVQAVGDRNEESSAAEGNCVVIQCENGTQIWMAHLEEGSVVVKPGDRVATGQAVGACGATGNANVAHLHIHAQAGDKPVPLLFRGRFLIANDRFTAF